MIRPHRLKKGDTVGILAPASPPDTASLERSLPFLEKLGLRVKMGRHVRDIHGYVAGTEDDRLADLHDFFADPEVKAIICAGGGYGTARMADRIDYRLIRQNPKPFWGYSDITFLHNAFFQEAGLVTFHGPMMASDVGKDDFHEASAYAFQQLFQPVAFTYSEELSPLTVLAEGKATGSLVGGNLTLICSTLGTPFEINTKGKILLLEDIDEEPYCVDGMLNQLRLAGKLKDAAGIVVGDFKNSVPKKGKNSFTFDEVVDQYLSNLPIPVMKGFKIGHCQPHYAVPLGVKSTICTETKTLVVEPGVQ